MGLTFGRRFFRSLPGGEKSETALEAGMVALHLRDDMGLWCNYGQLQRDFLKLREDGVIQGQAGCRGIPVHPLGKARQGRPRFPAGPAAAHRAPAGGAGRNPRPWDRRTIRPLVSAGRRVDRRSGHALLEARGTPPTTPTTRTANAGRSSTPNSTATPSVTPTPISSINGLPLNEQRRLAADLWGSAEALDAPGFYTPVNPAKVRRAKWSILRKELHDALALCNWMGPWVASPLKERGYAGDNSLESKLYAAATGHRLDREELDRVAERIFTLHRALTIRDMGELDMRARHDRIPDWAFQDPQDRPAFTAGVVRMDRADMDTAMDLFYDAMGWDRTTGAPVAGTYDRLGLTDVGRELAKKKLLPGDA